MILKELISEVKFKTSRSGGPGGQHANKTETRVELIFDIMGSDLLTEMQKRRICGKLKRKLVKGTVLHLTCDQTRNQHQNKGLVIKRFFEIIKLGLTIDKIRIPTKTPRKAIARRLGNKKKKSQTKQLRGKVNPED